MEAINSTDLQMCFDADGRPQMSEDLLVFVAPGTLHALSLILHYYQQAYFCYTATAAYNDDCGC